jgi:hypothetical protein
MASCQFFSKEERMIPVTFDAFSRRASLLRLGTAGLAALAVHSASGAAKKKKERRRQPALQATGE